MNSNRLPKEFALAAITTMEAANRDLSNVYLPAFDPEFSHQAPEEGSAFVPSSG